MHRSCEPLCQTTRDFVVENAAVLNSFIGWVQLSTGSITPGGDTRMSESSASCRARNPEIKLEDVRKGRDTNTCRGRGRKTASGRGYNAERLAHVVFAETNLFFSVSSSPWYDDYATASDELSYRTEVKSCVDRYQTAAGEEGRYGQFRIWKPHHDRLVQMDAKAYSDAQGVYFFVVYTIEDGIEKEIGKLVAPVQTVDDVLDTWSSANHVTMGEKKNRQISWRLLLKKLGVSRDRFENELIIDITND